MTGSQPTGKRGPMPSLSSELDQAFGETVDAGQEAAVAFLVGLSGKHAGKLFRIRPGESIIGRTSKALVVLDEKGVSYKHASLTFTPGRCVVTDLGSTNGTYVNDERLSEPHELVAGDVMRFGNSRLGYLTDAEDEEQHTRALARVNQPTIGAITSPVKSPSIPPPGALAHVPAQQVIVGDGGAAVPQQNGVDLALEYFDIALGLLKRYKWYLIVGAALCALAGVGTMWIWPPKATASAEIMLRQESIANTATPFASRTVDYFAFAEKNFVHVDLVAQTVKDMGLPESGTEVRNAADGLDFESLGGGVFKGSFTHQNPIFAEKFLSRHIKNYLETEITKSIRVLASEVALVQTQYDDNGALLKEHEAALRDFKSEHLAALPANATDQMRSRLGLVARRDELQASVSRYTKEYELARSRLQSEDAFLASNVGKSAVYESGIAEIRRNIAAARAKGYTDEHPELKGLLEEEKSLVRLRDSTVSSETTETDRRTNPEHKRLQLQVAELKIAIEAASQELGQINERLSEVDEVSGAMPAVEAELAAKVRQVENSKSLHDRLYEQLKAKELELQFERASVEARYEVMSAPEAFPVDRKRSAAMRAGAGGVLGLVLGFVAAVLHFVVSFVGERRKSLKAG